MPNIRLKRTKDKLRHTGLDGLLISNTSSITYLTSFSAFSTEEREAFLFITANKNYIITDGRYSEAVVNKVKDFELLEVSTKRSAKQIIGDLSKKYRIIGFESDDLTFEEHNKLSKFIKDFVSQKNFIEKLRITKEANEIESIKKASAIGDLAFEHIIDQLKIGVTERQIAHNLVSFIKARGADQSFDPIVAFGENSSVPHHQTGNTKLRRAQIVLLDFGVKFENYCSDMTRTVFFGKANSKFKRVYQTVLQSQQRAIELVNGQLSIVNAKSRLPLSKIDSATREFIIEQGFPTIPHSVGHGIGIDVHELPHLSINSKDYLQNNSVFSIEPGIYIPSFGGVRIEDLVLFAGGQIQVLTNSKKDLIEI